MANSERNTDKKRQRSPNIANSLIKNSRSAFVLAIEIHNKPVCDYRLQSVVIFLIHSWELLLKAYCYKYLNQKKILKKDADNRYMQLSQIIDLIFHANASKFRILKENIDTLNSYRNLIVHSHWYESMDQLIFELIAKSVLLYRDFIREFFSWHDLEEIKDTPILPIAFKLPYTSIDILTNNFASSKTPIEVLDFISSIRSRVQKMADDWVDESIFVSIKTEFVNEKHMRNSNIIAQINPNDWIAFRKETMNRIVSDKGAQPMRWLLTKDEREAQFPIPTKKCLKEKVIKAVWEKWKQKWWGDNYFNRITKTLEARYEWSGWYPNVDGSGWKRYTNEFYDLVISEYGLIQD